MATAREVKDHREALRICVRALLELSWESSSVNFPARQALNAVRSHTVIGREVIEQERAAIRADRAQDDENFANPDPAALKVGQTFHCSDEVGRVLAFDNARVELELTTGLRRKVTPYTLRHYWTRVVPP